MKKISVSGFLIALLVMGMGCGSSAATTTTPAATEPAYARAITETTLKGLSDDNLEEYVKYGSDAFKAAVTQAILDKTSQQITSQLGTYQSVTYVSTETQPPYTVVHYKARYSKGEVGVRMVFDGNQKVAGQWFE